MLFITCSTCIEYISNILVVIFSLWSKLSIICQACQREQTSSRCKFGLKWGARGGRLGLGSAVRTVGTRERGRTEHAC
jgi:hypothetical protein